MHLFFLISLCLKTVVVFFRVYKPLALLFGLLLPTVLPWCSWDDRQPFWICLLVGSLLPHVAAFHWIMMITCYFKYFRDFFGDGSRLYKACELFVSQLCFPDNSYYTDSEQDGEQLEGRFGGCVQQFHSNDCCLDISNCFIGLMIDLRIAGNTQSNTSTQQAPTDVD